MEIKADAYLKIQDKVLLRQLQVFGTCTWVAEAARLKMEEKNKNTVKTQLIEILIFNFIKKNSLWQLMINVVTGFKFNTYIKLYKIQHLHNIIM